MDKEEELQRIWREWLQQYDLTETMVLKGEIWKRELHCTCCPKRQNEGSIAPVTFVEMLGAILLFAFMCIAIGFALCNNT